MKSACRSASTSTTENAVGAAPYTGGSSANYNNAGSNGVGTNNVAVEQLRDPGLGPRPVPQVRPGVRHELRRRMSSVDLPGTWTRGGQEHRGSKAGSGRLSASSSPTS